MTTTNADAAMKTLADLITEPFVTALSHMSRTAWAFEEESRRLAKETVERGGVQPKISKELGDLFRDAANAAVVFTTMLAMAAGEDPVAMHALARKLVEMNNRMDAAP